MVGMRLFNLSQFDEVKKLIKIQKKNYENLLMNPMDLQSH